MPDKKIWANKLKFSNKTLWSQVKQRRGKGTMPELPEVETLCRQLHKKIAGTKITASEVYDSKLAHVKNLKAETIAEVRRNGKTIEIILNNNCSVLIHLRMTGRLLWQKDSNVPKHSRWRMSLAAGNIFLVDPRRFATIQVLNEKLKPADNDILLGFDQAAFMKKHGSRKSKVKSIIMDQNAIAGIGNIYACEILHCSGIHPERKADTLSYDDWKKIFRNAESILGNAIKKRGTSISDWRDLYGLQGENQHELKIYGREGKSCGNCGSIIKRMKQGGRSTFYCSQCQE
jgi:formamidopyrimidine-DNA glycosylase